MRENYYQSEEFKDVLARYEEAQEKGVSCYLDSDDFVDISDFYLDNDQPMLALDAVEVGLSQHGDDELLLVVKAGVLVFLHRFDEARQIVDGLNADDNFDVIYLQAQLTYAQEGNAEMADKLFHEWMEHVEREWDVNAPMDEEEEEEPLDPQEAEGEVRNAIVHVMMSFADLSSAEHGFYVRSWAEYYLKRYPKLGEYESDYTLADVVREENLIDLVEVVYERLLDHAPYLNMGWTVLAAAQQANGKNEEALNSVEFALAIDPSDINALITKGQAFYALANFEEALRIFLQARELLQNASEDEYIAFCYYNLQRENEALPYLRSAAEYVQNDAELDPPMKSVALYEIADGFAVCDRPAEGLPLIEQALRIEPDKPDYLLLYGSLLIGTCHLHRATRVFTKLLNATPRACYYLVLIASRFLAYDYAEIAVKMLESALKFGEAEEDFTNRDHAYAYLALAYHHLRNLEATLANLKTACERVPDMVRTLFADYIPEGVEPADFYDYLVKVES